MKKRIAAIATDDGHQFVGRHFGDADFYDLYEIFCDKAVFLKRIQNSTDVEPELHDNPRKAFRISELLLQENVSVAVAKNFGPNLRRIKKKFVCIISNDIDISHTLENIHHFSEEIESEWEKGDSRNYLKLNGKTSIPS